MDRFRFPILGSVIVLFAMALLLNHGCDSDGRVPVYPVKGKVLFQGKPLSEALVVFIPTKVAPAELRPNGVVQGDGTFTLSTYDADDGAPAGDYVVKVVWDAGGGPMELKRSFALPKSSPRSDPTKGRYASESTSPLRATIVNGDNNLKLFMLE